MQLNIFRGLRPRAPATVASKPAFRADSSPTSFKNPAHAPEIVYFLLKSSKTASRMVNSYMGWLLIRNRKWFDLSIINEPINI